MAQPVNENLMVDLGIFAYGKSLVGKASYTKKINLFFNGSHIMNA
jgi:hypothetical protein